MTLLFILVTLAHFHFVLVVDTVPYSGALSNCRSCDVIEWTIFLFQVSWSRIFIVCNIVVILYGKYVVGTEFFLIVWPKGGAYDNFPMFCSPYKPCVTFSYQFHSFKLGLYTFVLYLGLVSIRVSFIKTVFPFILTWQTMGYY